MIDPRLEKLAKNLVNYSCSVKKGEKVWIDASGIGYEFPAILAREVYRAGGYPFVYQTDPRVKREIMMGADESYWEILRDRDKAFMEQMDAYIGIRGGQNNFELSDVPVKNTQQYSSIYAEAVHHNIRVKKTKWVILRYPTEGMSQLSKTSTERFEDFYFNVCNLDYQKMSNAMDALVDLMNRTDKVRIVAKDTDITFSIKDIPSVKCDGKHNIPDGEVYTAPVRDSVNGVITYNVGSIEHGILFENVRLEFKDGKIIKATANFTDKINEIFDTDEGARYIGEFSLGLNPYIENPMGDILFDEKIAGSIHFTPGACYEDAYNGNKSAVHWDLVQVHTEKYGGGEIWFDGTLVRKNGLFVIDELKYLNPEYLK
ncbi:MAG: aminopeptidase [Clostridiales bacterium]|nr:aminopeptidase [Clostridiales bacterium]